MKFDFKKFSEKEQIQTAFLIGILIVIIMLILVCPVKEQMFCSVIVVFATFFNFLHRKEDSKFSQIRTPILTGFALCTNKAKTSLDLILRPEVIDSYDISKFDFENSLLSLEFISLILFFCIGFVIWMFIYSCKLNDNGLIIEGLQSVPDDNKQYQDFTISFTKTACVITVIFGVLSSVSRPLYMGFIQGTFDYAYFQKYILTSSFDIFFHSVGILILMKSGDFYNSLFTTEKGGFLITDDKRIIKYKGKKKLIYIPRDFKLFMTDTFENCDSTYEIHFEEGTTEIPPLKFKKSFPKIVYPSSLTALREYSLFLKNQNPYDNSTTIKMLLNNPTFKIIDGCMINTKNNTLLFRLDHKDSEFKIPDCVEKIGKYAFDDLLLAKAYNHEESRQNELNERVTKYINFSNGRDKEYESFEEPAASERAQLKKISFTKNISYVHPDALELATGLREIYIPEDSDFDISESNPTRPYIKYLGKGKKITHRMIERLLHIHEKIKSGCYPNSKQLAYDLETSEPTINRDIEYLRDSRYAPIQYDFTNRGYYYTEDYELFFDK